MTTTTQRTVKIGENKTAYSGAQAITLLAYGDLHGLAVRNLDCSCECEDFEDFAACLTIIRSYNDFDSVAILEKATDLLCARRYWNENNPNNGRNLFEYTIAREGSPAFYVKFNGFLSPKKLIDNVPTEYTKENFKEDMAQAQTLINADEFDIEDETSISCTVRFWFD